MYLNITCQSLIIIYHVFGKKNLTGAFKQTGGARLPGIMIKKIR